MWKRGGHAARLVDTMVPAERHLPAPAREPDDLPRRLPTGCKWWLSIRWQLDMILNALALVVAVWLVVVSVRDGLSFTVGHVFMVVVVGVWLARRL